MSTARSRRRRAVVLLLRTTAVLTVCILFALLVYRLARDPGTRAGQAVADVRLGVIWPDARTWPSGLRRAATSGTFRLSDLRGYPVVVNFWASWCSPCRHEADILASAAEARRGRVVFVGVDVHDLTSDARRFLRVHETPYVAVRSDAIAGRFGLVGLPETFYVDRRGRIRNVTQGELSAATLDRELNRASRD